MLPLALALLFAASATPPVYQVDLSSHPAARTAAPVAQPADHRCQPTGDSDAAVAIVVVGRRLGASAWGHAALRFVTCEDGSLEDVLIEAYRFDRRDAADLPARFPAARIPPGRATLRRNRGRLYLHVQDRPVDRGTYGRALAANRDIWEAWLDLPPDAVRALRADLLGRVDRQKGRLEAGTPLAEGRYRALSRSCMVPVAEALAWQRGRPDQPPAVTFPFRVLEDVEDQAQRLVVHPSPGLWRRQLEQVGPHELGATVLQGRLAIARDESLVRWRLGPDATAWTAEMARVTRGSDPQPGPDAEDRCSEAPCADPGPVATAAVEGARAP